MSTDGSESVTRRGFMRAATGTATAAGAAGTAAAGGGGGQESGGGKTKTVKVGPGGNMVFEPADITVPPGTTVKWVWKSDNHNIVVSSQPSGTNWKGTPGGKSKTYNTGYTYTHTFEQTGTFEYFCQPHKPLGMKGSVTVKEGASLGSGKKSAGPAIPSSAKTLGIATTTAMVFTLGLAYFFMKYGGDYGDVAEQ